MSLLKAMLSFFEPDGEDFDYDAEELDMLSEVSSEDADREMCRDESRPIVFGRWIQLLLRMVVVMAMMIITLCYRGGGRRMILTVFGSWVLAELLWCGVREFERAGDLVLHELAVIYGTYLFVFVQPVWKVIYVFGLAQISAVMLSNRMGRRIWEGKEAAYNERIAKVFFVLANMIVVMIYRGL